MIQCYTLQEGIDFLEKRKEEYIKNKRQKKLSEQELIEGTQAEIEFLEMIWYLSETHPIYISDAVEDEGEHWDIAIGNMLYDVKSNCSIEPYKIYTMWVELVTRMGKIGSLYGKANFLVFRYNDPYHFIVCSRKKVLEHLEGQRCLHLKRVTNPKEAYDPYIPYGRAWHDEKIVRVPIKILEGLEMSRVIKRESTSEENP